MTPKQQKAFEVVKRKIDSMTHEEIAEALTERAPKCDPGTCGGECQGIGWCETARKFRLEVFGIRESTI